MERGLKRRVPYTLFAFAVLSLLIATLALAQTSEPLRAGTEFTVPEGAGVCFTPAAAGAPYLAALTAHRQGRTETEQIMELADAFTSLRAHKKCVLSSKSQKAVVAELHWDALFPDGGRLFLIGFRFLNQEERSEPFYTFVTRR